MILKVIKAEYQEGYKVKLTFNDGVEKIVDLENELYGKIFEPIRDIDKFNKFYIDCNTISWKNGADISAEYLHNL